MGENLTIGVIVTLLALGNAYLTTRGYAEGPKEMRQFIIDALNKDLVARKAIYIDGDREFEPDHAEIARRVKATDDLISGYENALIDILNGVPIKKAYASLRNSMQEVWAHAELKGKTLRELADTIGNSTGMAFRGAAMALAQLTIALENLSGAINNSTGVMPMGATFSSTPWKKLYAAYEQATLETADLVLRLMAEKRDTIRKEYYEDDTIGPEIWDFDPGTVILKNKPRENTTRLKGRPRVVMDTSLSDFAFKKKNIPDAITLALIWQQRDQQALDAVLSRNCEIEVKVEGKNITFTTACHQADTTFEGYTKHREYTSSSGDTVQSGVWNGTRTLHAGKPQAGPPTDSDNDPYEQVEQMRYRSGTSRGRNRN